MSKDTMGELRKSLYGRSSVFTGSGETPVERIVYYIIQDAIMAGENAVWICLNETPRTVLGRFSSYGLPLAGLEERLWFVDMSITGDIPITGNTSRCAFMDYVSITMRVVEILRKHPSSLVMLDNIRILDGLEHQDVTARFIKYLNDRIIAAGGGLITLLANKWIQEKVESEFIRFFDIIIPVEGNRINVHTGSKEFKLQFGFSGNELILHRPGNEKDLKELFNLTAEEKEKLELEVAEKALLYKELLD